MRGPATEPSILPRVTNRLARHARQTFLAGAFALVPIVVTVVAVAYVDGLTRFLSVRLTGRPVPLLGIFIAVAGVYAVGLAARSIVGRFFIGLTDRVLDRLPLLRELYRAWKQIGYAPDGGEGMYARVVLVPADGGAGHGAGGDSAAGDAVLQLGFTSDPGGAGDAGRVWVFVPNTPNPVVGRLLFVERRHVWPLAIGVDEAFKLLISTGNYQPPGLTAPPARAEPSRPVVDATAGASPSG